MPTIDVYGYVIKESDSLYGATVKLYKEGNYLSETTSDINGFYLLNVCGHQQGSGIYSVRATKYIKGQLWWASENFYWNEPEDMESFEIDLYFWDWK